LRELFDIFNALTYQHKVIVLIITGVVVVLPILMYGVKRRKRRREKIEAQVRRVKMANEPGYERPRSSMRTYIKDGVITYSKRGPSPSREIHRHKEEKKEGKTR